MSESKGVGVVGKRDLNGRALSMIASGRARSRRELAAALGAAASTVSVIVQQLVDAGWVRETDEGPSTGGRRPRILQLDGPGNYVLCADVGGNHARVGLIDVEGAPVHTRAVEFDVGAGPEAGLERLAAEFETLMQDRPGARLLAIGLALPGPVDVDAGCVDSPSRMPGWHRFPAADVLAQRFGVPVAVENDANAMALGEYGARDPRPSQMILIKAGTAIGSGFIIDGQIYHGATGAAGDITHVRTAAAGQTPCSCGNRGCLETIASGAAVARLLREQGVDAETTSDVVRLVDDADPTATGLVRDAGRHLGTVVAAIVNFFNPAAVYLNGVLSTMEPFVAAFRSQLYEGCHPLMTKELTISASALGLDAGLVGAGRLALTRVFDHPLHPSQPLNPLNPLTTPVRKES